MKQWARIAPVFVVWMSVFVTLAALSGAAYQRGNRTDPVLRFLGSWKPTIDEARIVCPIEYALRSDEMNDVIFVGDSSCNDGIDPARLPDFRSYNLGTVGSAGTVGILLSAKCYLKHHPRPRLIVLCISPFRFEVGAQSIGGTYPEQLAVAYGTEVTGVLPEYKRAALLVRRGATEFGERGDRRNEPLYGMPEETFLSYNAKVRAARGFFALPSLHGGRWTAETPPPRNFILPEWDDMVRRMATACKDSHSILAIRFAPIWSGVSNSRNFTQLETWGSQLEEAFPGTVVLCRPATLAWDRELMYDFQHLNAAGVAKFMPIVAKDVQSVLGK
jgi:hypothetical protein